MASETIFTERLRFRFTTDHGDVYASAGRFCERTETRPAWKVAFAFRSPLDRRELVSMKVRDSDGRVVKDADGKPVVKRVDLGHVIAEGRLNRGRIGVCLAELCTGMDRELLQHRIVEHLLRAVGSACPQHFLGFRPFFGKGKGNFAGWFKGKFLEQLRERYA